MDDQNVCPVCGFAGLPEPAYIDGDDPSHEICPSCGFQFGVSDVDRGWSFEEWRQRWIDQGMPWSSPSWDRPADWDARDQLDRLMRGR